MGEDTTGLGTLLCTSKNIGLIWRPCEQRLYNIGKKCIQTFFVIYMLIIILCYTYSAYLIQYMAYNLNVINFSPTVVYQRRLFHNT